LAFTPELVPLQEEEREEEQLCEAGGAADGAHHREEPTAGRRGGPQLEGGGEGLTAPGTRRVLSLTWSGLAGHGGRRKSILVFLLNTKIFHRGKVVLPGDDLVLVVLHGGLAQVALEAGPGEAGGGTAQERQEGTVLNLLETHATPEAADGKVNDDGDGGARGGAGDGGDGGAGGGAGNGDVGGAAGGAGHAGDAEGVGGLGDDLEDFFVSIVYNTRNDFEPVFMTLLASVY